MRRAFVSMLAMKRLPFVLLFFCACTVERDADLESTQKAALVSSDLVIAEVFGGGGITGGSFNNDYVVLFNRGGVTATTNGLRISYASESNNFGTSTVDLPSASIAPGGSFLVKLASSGGAGSALPTPDATGAINMGAGAGKLALTPVSGGIGSGCGSASTQCDPAKWIDLVGWGDDPSQFEGTKATGGTNSTVLRRINGGCTDTGDNGSDFAEVAAATPRSSASAATPCAPVDLGPDFSTLPDLAGTFALLNEVRFNPGGSDNGQEFIELIGAGTLPANTWILSVDGDSGSAARINYAKNVSSLAFGASGLMLVKGTSTTFAGVTAGTTIVSDVQLNGAPLQNGAESILLVTAASPLTITAGATLYTSLTGLTVLDAIAASDGTGTSYGGAAIPGCPPADANPVHAALRIAGDLRPKTVAAWYAGQCVGVATFLGLDLVSICSPGGPVTYSLSPGRPNNDPQSPPPDLALGPDLKVATDLSTTPKDFSTATDLGTADLAATLPDLAQVDDFGITLPPADFAKPPTNARREGCAMSGTGAPLGAPVLVALAFLLALRRRRATP